jgi:hypothetical protein
MTTAGDDMERDFETNPYTKDERRVAEYIAGLGVGGGDDPIGFILASHAALAAAGPGREETIEECAQIVDRWCLADSTATEKWFLYNLANKIRALAAQTAKPVPVEAVEIIRVFLACPEIAECAPEDKDPETDAIERRARALLAMAEKE